MTTTPEGVELQVYADADAAARAAARLFADLARDAVRARGRFVVALSGGRTPQPVHRLLATELRAEVPWAQVHVWFGDERCVAPDDADSNYGMARMHLLDHVPLPAGQVRRLPGELPPGIAADQAEAELREFAGVAEGMPSAPLFDLVMLGVGEDGHTASLFPGARTLVVRDRLVIPARAPDNAAVKDRLTLTLPALNLARVVLLLAPGASKHAALEGAAAQSLPVARVAGMERTVWMVDRGAVGEESGGRS